ncbi:hypothetical protein GCM10020331_065610 [Ectobacillus funiculus]
MLIAGFAMALLFLLLAIQYIIRTAELLIILIMSPLAAWSIMNEDLNIWSIWWREAISIVFTQSFQIMVIWLAFNNIGDAKGLQDFIVGFGFLAFCLMSPTFFLRKFFCTRQEPGEPRQGLQAGQGNLCCSAMSRKKFVG